MNPQFLPLTSVMPPTPGPPVSSIWAVRIPPISAFFLILAAVESSPTSQPPCSKLISLLTFLLIAVTYLVSLSSLRKGGQYSLASALNAITGLFCFSFFVINTITPVDSPFYDYCFTCIFLFSVIAVTTTSLYIITSLVFLSLATASDPLDEKNSAVVDVAEWKNPQSKV